MDALSNKTEQMAGFAEIGDKWRFFKSFLAVFM